MLEKQYTIDHTCFNDNYQKEKKKATFYRVVRIIAIVFLFALEIFVFTVSQVYWYSDRSLFWWFVFYSILFAVPVVGFIVLVSILLRRLCVEYDYELTSEYLEITRVIRGTKRKFLAHIDLNNVHAWGKVTSDEYYVQFPAGQKRKPMICACNIDNPNIYFLRANFISGKDSVEKVVVIEPSRAMYDEMLLRCVGASFAVDSKWTKEQ